MSKSIVRAALLDSQAQLSREINKDPEICTIPRAEEAELHSRIKAGDQEARDKLIKAHIRLAMYVIHEKFYVQAADPELREELYSCAFLGLMEALEKFDPAKGKFGSFSVWYVIKNVNLLLGRVNGHRPPPTSNFNELAKEDLEFDPESTTDISPLTISVAKSEIEKLKNDLSIAIEAVRRSESPRNLEMFLRIYGLGGYQWHSLEAAGKLAGITRERVRQLKAKMLKRVRKSLGLRDIDEAHQWMQSIIQRIEEIEEALYNVAA